jgi:hypothetical protein
MMANPCCGLQIAKCPTPVETLRKERVITFGSLNGNLEVSPNKKKTWSQEIKECYSFGRQNESFRTNS